MLGDHQLGAAIQAQGTLKDVGGQLYYRNSAHRWNWAISAGHIPYLLGYASQYYDPSTGQSIYEQNLQRIYVDQLTLLSYRPWSQTRRFEFSGGFTRLGFNNEIRRYYLLGSNVIDEERIDAGDGGYTPLNMFEASAAIVGDNSNFGFTSPVVGQRYRFEVSPTFGSLQYQTLLGDYRRYLFKQPITFAFRGMTYGRYGKDSGTGRLTPLFLGYETYMRGYSFESFRNDECTVGTSQQPACPEFDRLIGSKIAVANFEIRVPLFGVPGLGLINMPFLPTEIAPFFDAGVAWWGQDGQVNNGTGGVTTATPVNFTFDRNTTDRVPVFSTGISARMNILGYLVLEAYYAYPFQRPARGAHFGFNISPGW
jgi:hypothetical protein